MQQPAETEFSWSWRRSQLLEKCRRAYFLRYYAASGGWDRYSNDSTRHIYILKQLKPADVWLENLLRDSVKEILARQQESVPKASARLKSQVMKKFYREANELRRFEWQHDPKRLNLTECYYAHGPNVTAEVMDQAENDLLKCIENLAGGEIWEELVKPPVIAWKNLPDPVQFYLSGVKVWTRPGLTRLDQGKLKIVNLKFRESSEYLIPASLAVMAACRNPANENRCESRTVFLENMETREGFASFAETEQLVIKSAAEMLTHINPDGSASELDFPQCREEFGGACLSCEFRQICFP